MQTMTAPNPPRSWQDLRNAPAIGTLIGAASSVYATLADGQARLHTVPMTGAPAFSLLLLRSGDSVRAYANHCAHLGLPLAVKQEHLIFAAHTSISCNVHYARFRWHDGVCDRGECVGESLLSIPLMIDSEGNIRIAAAQ